MYHLNIRSLPEHFIEFTAYIEHLNIDFKIIALSETWLKPHHIDYIIPIYNIENELRIKRRGGGVSLYIHNSLQYKVRNDLKIDNDQETINSVFVEIDKNTTNTKRNLIVGCIYRPPWVKIADFITAAPNDTAYKRWSCHSGFKLLCKLCRTSPPPAMGTRFTVFWACRPCGPAGWLALLLTKAGDVETNPGPTTLNKRVWICDICHKQIHVRKQISIRCHRIEHWVHLRCAGIRQAQYTDTWTCHLHRESRLTPHTDITPPHRSRPLSKPPTHSPPTPPTPPQPKHRHMANTPPIPRGLVKPKPNSLIHSPPSPPTPPQAKHIHMSHTPPTPLTSTSPVLDKTPEPRVPLIHALTATTPSPRPHTSTTVTLPPSHSHTTHTCNTNNSTCITVAATTARTT